MLRNPEEWGTAEEEMVRWYHWFDGHEFEQAPGVGDGQGGPVCCSPWGGKELDTTEQLDKVFISLSRLSLVVVHGGYSLL